MKIGDNEYMEIGDCEIDYVFVWPFKVGYAYSRGICPLEIFLLVLSSNTI